MKHEIGNNTFVFFQQHGRQFQDSRQTAAGAADRHWNSILVL